MTRAYPLQAVIAALIVSVVCLWAEKTMAGEELSAVVGVPVQALTASEMASIEGKLNRPLSAARGREPLETEQESSSSPTTRSEPDPNPFDFSPAQVLSHLREDFDPLTTLPFQVLKSVSLPPLLK